MRTPNGYNGWMGFSRDKVWLVTGAVFGLLAVSLGAYGAHGLEEQLENLGYTGPELAKRVANWKTATEYQMYHALALLAVGLIAARRCGVAIHLAGTTMTLGTLLFSGCLFVWVLGGPAYLVHAVPFGGLLLIAGWICLAIAAVRLPRGGADSACRVE